MDGFHGKDNNVVCLDIAAKKEHIQMKKMRYIDDTSDFYYL